MTDTTMTAPAAVLVALAALTLFNNAVHWYTHHVTYAMFRRVGEGEFVGFHREYERRLGWALYLPYGLLMAATLAFVWVRPAGVGPGWALALLVLNASITALSVGLAVPVHPAPAGRGVASRAGWTRWRGGWRSSAVSALRNEEDEAPHAADGVGRFSMASATMSIGYAGGRAWYVSSAQAAKMSSSPRMRCPSARV